MEKLEQDNRVLAHLDKKIKEISNNGLSSSLPTLNATTTDHYMTTTSGRGFYGLTGSHTTHHTPGHLHTSTTAIHPPSSHGLGLSLPPPQVGPTLNITLGPSKQQQQNLAYAVTQKLEQLRLAEDVVDSIEIPNRGRCKVYIAKYAYDPFKQSPNENPEAELSLNAGDFVLIFLTLLVSLIYIMCSN